MFHNDLIISFILMALLFLRQIVILKDINKINYAPIMLGVGVLSSIVHFIINPQTHDTLLLARESLFPLLVSVIFYIIMNIFHQTQSSFQVRKEEEFTTAIVDEISQLRDFILELENRMSIAQRESIQREEDIRKKFVEDIQALGAIELNQQKFLEKFVQMEEWHKEVKSSFAYFLQEQLPKLDDVVHKHIDILRIAESEHYNRLQELLKKAVEGRFTISDEIVRLEKKLDSLTSLMENLSDRTLKETRGELMRITKDFEKELLLLKSNIGVMATSLHEEESTVLNMRKESEFVMEQVLFASKELERILLKNSEVKKELFPAFHTLLLDIENIKSDYVKAQAQLSLLSDEFTKKEEETFAILTQEFHDKLEEALENLQKHYNTVSEDMTQKTNILAKQAQLYKGYENP